MEMKKKFAIYCSGNASRVLKFYSSEKNRVNYLPEAVIYDGEINEIQDSLKAIFGDNLFIISKSEISSQDLKRINNYTSEYIHSVLDENEIEYLICFGKRLLKKRLIDAYKDKLINFHPSLLPAFKGLNPVDQALSYGVSILGNTAHFIDEGIDSGKIILQSAMLTADFESYEDVLELQFPILKMILRDVLGYTVEPDDVFSELSNRKKTYFFPHKLLSFNG